jgi:hypothetical protein
VPTVVKELLSLPIRKASILVSHSQEHVVFDVRIDGLARTNLDDEKLVGVRCNELTGDQFGFSGNWGLTEVDMGLAQLVAMPRRAVSALYLAVVYADNNNSAISVG